MEGGVDLFVERPVRDNDAELRQWRKRVQALGSQCGHERAERGCEGRELREHQLENSLIESPDVCSELLSQICDIRREMSDRRSHLGKDLDWKLTLLLHEQSVLAAPTSG